MIRKIDSNIFSLTILKVTTFSRIRHGLNNLLVLAANIQKIPLKAKRIGKKVALSGNFNIFRATLSAQIGHGMTEKGI